MAGRAPGGTLRGRVLALTGALLVLLTAVAVSTVVARLEVQHADRQVNRVLVPAQDASFRLSKAWVDQETGERGYLLTGDRTFLQPYVVGQRDVASAHRQLETNLRGDAAGLALLRGVDAAGTAWQKGVATPEIAARAAGTTPSQAQLVGQATRGKQLFDALRVRLNALSSHLNSRVAAQLSRAHQAQTAATAVSLGALALALLGAVVAATIMRRALSAPVSRLLRQVQQVAGGDFDQPVETSGPAEVAAVATAVEGMRTRILRDTEEAAQAREELARHAEDDRIARDLHDLVIQRLFAAGMRLESVAARHPEAAPLFRGVIDELDLSIRELRTVIFGLTAHRGQGGLRARVMTLLRDSERSLGFRPTLVVTGPVDSMTDGPVADDVAASLTEILSNMARHAQATAAQVTLEVGEGRLRLEVADNGVGLPDQLDGPGRGLRNLVGRAESSGGSCAFRSRDGGGTVVEVQLPLSQVSTV